MKKTVLSILTCLALGSWANAQNVNIPNTNFKNALLAHGASAPVNGVNPITGGGISTIDTDGNGEISTTEAQAYTGRININSQGVSDLTGLEEFTSLSEFHCSNNSISSIPLANSVNLTTLYFYNNQLSSIDVTQHTNLTELQCGNNPIMSLDLSQNSALTNLYCSQTQLSVLDVTSNPNLVIISCQSNSITALDLTQNPNLEVLYCSGNQLTSLDVSTNTALEVLYCSDNELSSLDVSANTVLIQLQCKNNQQLGSLDVSANTALESVNCNNNQLTSLNVATGNNGSTLAYFYATGNPNLTCIQHDTGFDPTTNTNWEKDATASWSDNCSSTCNNYVTFGQIAFKNALLDHGVGITGAGISVIDTDGDGEICETEAQAYTGALDFSSWSLLNNSTGIEAFTNVTSINCGSLNQFTSLDVSNATNLTSLRCAGNQITSLDVSQNTSLVTLICATNGLTSLDVSNNTLLEELDCQNNEISSLDVSNNSALNYVYASDNELTTLNVANGNNSNLQGMLALFNPNLTCIQHDAGFDPTTASNWQKDATASWSDNCSASINENNISFSIVPNPTSGMVKIDTDVEINSVEIFSTSGQQVASFDTKEFDISALQSGVYFVKVLSDSGIATSRIIKK